jgi:hypothetical protein
MTMVFEMVFILGFWVGNNWFGLSFFFGIATQSLAVCDAMQAKIEYAKLGSNYPFFCLLKSIENDTDLN